MLSFYRNDSIEASAAVVAEGESAMGTRFWTAYAAVNIGFTHKVTFLSCLCGSGSDLTTREWCKAQLKIFCFFNNKMTG